MIILENKNRLMKSDSVNRTMSQPNGDVSHQHDSLQRPQLVSYNSSVSLDTTASAVTTLSNQANSMPRNIRDPTVFALISGQGSISNSKISFWFWHTTFHIYIPSGLYTLDGIVWSGWDIKWSKKIFSQLLACRHSVIWIQSNHMLIF